MTSKWAADVLPIIDDIRQSGAVSLREIAVGLNERAIQTRRGGNGMPCRCSRCYSEANKGRTIRL
jgi:hypothetical protein